MAAASLLAYGFESIAWPIALGRDGNDYVTYYAQLWHHTVFPEVMLSRTPVAPLIIGVPLQLFGAVGAEVVFGFLYVVTIVSLVAVALRLDRRLAAVVAPALLLYLPLAALFHTLSSDAPFACGFAVWTLLVVRAMQAPDCRKFGVVGAWAGLLVLTRPSAQVLVAAAALPLFLRLPWVRIGVFALAIVAAFLVVVGGWEACNYIRYGEATLYRLGPAAMPFYRLYLSDRLIKPDNGPASRQLAAAVESDLLPKQPYRAYHVTLDQFFSQGTDRQWADLVGLSDRKWGWSSDYAKLRAAAIEAIRRRPVAYARSVFSTLRIMLAARYVLPASQQPTKSVAGVPPVRAEDLDDQLTPMARLPIRYTTPDHRITVDWRSVAHPKVRFAHVTDEAASKRLQARVGRLVQGVPSRNGSSSAARWLNRLANWYPTMSFWLLAGVFGVLIRRGRRLLLPTLLAVIAAGSFVAIELGVSGTVEYRIPFDPTFIVFGLAGLLGVERLRSE